MPYKATASSAKGHVCKCLTCSYPAPHLLSRSASRSMSSTSSLVRAQSNSFTAHFTCNNTSRRSSSVRLGSVSPRYNCCSSAARTVVGVCTITCSTTRQTAHTLLLSRMGHKHVTECSVQQSGQYNGSVFYSINPVRTTAVPSGPWLQLFLRFFLNS